MRLDHWIAKRLRISERSAREKVATGAVSLNGIVTTESRASISRFDAIALDTEEIQIAIPRLHLALHKPIGILSATTDDTHRTVIDLIDHPHKATLHLAGRLDRSSSGLVLLTNDSVWSEALSHPQNKVEKEYLVETDRPIPDRAVRLFESGFHFESEGIHTAPATLEILAPAKARVILHEGRYHQIKRMFHRIDEIRLRSLHRVRIGPWDLDGLAPGSFRILPVPT